MYTDLELVKLAAFTDELEKQANPLKFLSKGFKQLAGLGTKAAKHKGLGNYWKHVVQKNKGSGWEAAKHFLPGAAAVGTTGLAGYGALKGTQGVLAPRRNYG